ncbi:MAG: RNA polymerase sigma factor [Alphaproteobacteria bacterium]|nr:RNA polymerase sigma factor [Alphaproteobacteria bacterium SS10]
MADGEGPPTSTSLSKPGPTDWRQSDWPDDKLISAAVNGDRDAFGCLIDRHYDRIYRLAYGWMGQREAAEDAAQDVVVKLVNALPKFGGQSKFTTWLHRLVLNHLHDIARKNKRRRIDPGVVFEDLQIAANEMATDDALASRRALAAVNDLPEKLRDAVLLVHWEGMTHEAAGQVLGCKGGTVSWRLNEAKTKLSELLGEPIEKRDSARGKSKP